MTLTCCEPKCAETNIKIHTDPSLVQCSIDNTLEFSEESAIEQGQQVIGISGTLSSSGDSGYGLSWVVFIVPV